MHRLLGEFVQHSFVFYVFGLIQGIGLPLNFIDLIDFCSLIFCMVLCKDWHTRTVQISIMPKTYSLI